MKFPINTEIRMSNGYSTAAKDGKYKILNPNNIQIMEGEIQGQTITFNFRLRDSENLQTQVMSLEGDTLHRRFGHLCAKYTEKLKDSVIGAPIVKVKATVTTCDVRAELKLKKHKHNSLCGRATQILKLIHVDIMGRINPESEDGHKYILILVDDWLHYLHTENLRTKDEAAAKIKTFVRNAKSRLTVSVASIQTDNALEFINQDLQKFFDLEGIHLDRVPPRTPELNSVVERMNGTLGNRIRALLYEGRCPVEWWHMAANMTTYLINRSPTAALEFGTPFERWFGHKPDVSKVRTFGCIARVCVPNQVCTKFQKRAWYGILVGYTNMSTKVYDVKTLKVYESGDVRVDELKQIEHLAPALKEKSDRKLIIEPKFIQTNLGPIGIIGNEVTSITFTEALNSEKAHKWQEAIDHEFRMMKDRKVWTVIDKPPGMVMDTKWVLKEQSKPDRIRYRARLCARGFKDKNKYAMNEIYSPTGEATTNSQTPVDHCISIRMGNSALGCALRVPLRRG